MKRKATTAQPDVKRKIVDWFRQNPNPPDEQVHELAESLNIDPHEFESIIYSLLTEYLPDKGESVGSRQVTAGRRQVVFLGNTGPNNQREWAVVQYRNGPNGDGETIMRVSTRLGVEPSINMPLQWTEKRYLYQYLKNMRHKLSRPGVILMNKLATADTKTAKKSKVQAGTWQEKAKAELEAELGGIETEYTRHTTLNNAFTLRSKSGRADNGESEWIVFKDMKSAEQYAIEYVAEMLNDDPSLFDKKWLRQHVTVSPTNIRLISNEDADSYVDNIRSEDEKRLLDEAGMLAKWESFETKKDALEDEMLDEMDAKKKTLLQFQIDKLSDAQDQLVDKADAKLRVDIAKRTADALKKDPVSWATELGFELDGSRPAWLQIDVKKAAKNAVRTDGVAHFLDSYDGDEVELDSGAVAFGTN